MAPHARSTFNQSRGICRPGERFASDVSSGISTRVSSSRSSKYVARVHPASLCPVISSPFGRNPRIRVRCKSRASETALPLLLSHSLGVEWERERTNVAVDRFAVRREEGGRAPPRPSCARVWVCVRPSSSDRKAEDESNPNKDRCLYHLREIERVSECERVRVREWARHSDKRKRSVTKGQMTGERWGSMCRDGWGGAAGHPVPRRLRWLIRLFVARRLGVGGLTGRPRHLRYRREFTGGQQRQGKMGEQRWNRVFAITSIFTYRRYGKLIRTDKQFSQDRFTRARARAHVCARSWLLRISEMRDAILYLIKLLVTLSHAKEIDPITINNWVKLSLHSFSRKKIVAIAYLQVQSTKCYNFFVILSILRV